MESLELFERVRLIGGRAVMATLVRTKGTTPRKAGARMFVSEGGTILGSVTIGGCVDARVMEEAGKIVANDVPQLLEMELGDEEAWEIGLTCGGTIQVFLEPLDFTDSKATPIPFYEMARREARSGKRTAIISLLKVPPSSQAPLGTQMLVDDHGNIHGTRLEDLDEQVVPDARDLMARGISQTCSYHLEGAGTIEVFFDVFAPAFPLLIFGASHVAIPLVSFAKILGFRTVVVDARPRFATRERFPEADDVIEGIPSVVADQLTMDSTTSVVLLAHDYKFEVPVLKRALASNVPYIGLLGSKRRGTAIFELLREQGIADRDLGRIRVPIGLDLGAQTAPEIALSTMAEILSALTSRTGGPLSQVQGKKILELQEP